MKANELMIGDWVNLSKGNWSKNRQVGLVDIEMIAESVYLAEPISLTAEILEKNFPDPEIVCWYPDNNTYRIIIGDNVALNIKYVHELQHALRLCGIEKEIEL